MSEKPADDGLAKAAEMLLGLDVGDRRILEQIHRAAVNGELISNHERAYVESLMEKHAAPDGKATAAAPRKSPEKPAGEETPDATVPRSSSKTLAIAGGAAAAAVAVAAVLLVSLGSAGEVEEPVAVLTVDVDSAGYHAGDFIIVEGLSEGAGGGAVDVSIVGPSGQVWYERVLPNADGSFSTITLAGSGGWSDGSYMVRAVHGDMADESAFSFGDSDG